MWIFGKSSEGKHDLHQAVRCGDIRVVARKLKKDGAVHLRDDKGQTALHIACMVGQADMVALLLQTGASTSVLDNEHKTPLMYAVLRSRVICIKTFLDRGPYSALSWSTLAMQLRPEPPYNSSLTRQPIIVGVGHPTLNVQEPEARMSVLHMCIEKGRSEKSQDALKLLLKFGCNVNLQTNEGKTALMMACQYELPLHAMRLIESNTNLNLVDNDNKSALMYAAEYGLADVIQKMMRRSVDCTITTTNGGFTALDLAQKAGHKDCVDALLKKSILLPSQPNSPLISSPLVSSDNFRRQLQLRPMESNLSIGSNPIGELNRISEMPLTERQQSLPDTSQSNKNQPIYGLRQVQSAGGEGSGWTHTIEPLESHNEKDPVEELQGIISNLKDQISSLSFQLQATQSQSASNETITSETTQNLDKENEIQTLRTQLDAAKEETQEVVGTYSRKIAAQQDHIEAFKDELSNLSFQLQLKEEVNKTNLNIEKLEARLEVTEKEVQTTPDHQQESETAQTTEELKRELSKSRAEVERTLTIIRQLQGLNGQLRKKLEGSAATPTLEDKPTIPLNDKKRPSSEAPFRSTSREGRGEVEGESKDQPHIEEHVAATAAFVTIDTPTNTMDEVIHVFSKNDSISTASPTEIVGSSPTDTIKEVIHVSPKNNSISTAIPTEIVDSSPTDTIEEVIHVSPKNNSISTAIPTEIVDSSPTDTIEEVIHVSPKNNSIGTTIPTEIVDSSPTLSLREGRPRSEGECIVPAKSSTYFMSHNTDFPQASSLPGSPQPRGRPNIVHKKAESMNIRHVMQSLGSDSLLPAGIASNSSVKPIHVRIREFTALAEERNSIAAIPTSGAGDKAPIVSKLSGRSWSTTFSKCNSTQSQEGDVIIPEDISDMTAKLLESQRRAMERSFLLQMDRLKREKDLEIATLRNRNLSLQRESRDTK